MGVHHNPPLVMLFPSLESNTASLSIFELEFKKRKKSVKCSNKVFYGLCVLSLFPWQRTYWHAAVLLLEVGGQPGSTLPAHNLTFSSLPALSLQLHAIPISLLFPMLVGFWDQLNASLKTNDLGRLCSVCLLGVVRQREEKERQHDGGRESE